MLAGISSDYYLRLEQGRDHHPSAQVIDALAHALQLDEEATAHLHALSRPPPRQTPPRRARARTGLDRAADRLLADPRRRSSKAAIWTS